MDDNVRTKFSRISQSVITDTRFGAVIYFGRTDGPLTHIVAGCRVLYTEFCGRIFDSSHPGLVWGWRGGGWYSRSLGLMRRGRLAGWEHSFKVNGENSPNTLSKGENK